MLILVLTVLGSLAISFFCSIAEAVILSVQHAQIEALGKSRAAEILREFKREIDIPIAAIVSFHTVAHTVGASVCGVTYVAQLAAPVAYAVTGLTFVLKPLLFLTSVVAKVLRGDHENPVTSLEEIRLLVALGRTEGALAGRVADMIEGATALRELTAYEVMVPRSQVVFLSGERTIAENLDLIRRSQHSRFPYTPDADLDHAKGVILVKDLLFRDGALATGTDIDFDQLQTPLLVVPASAPLEKVLRTFQEERRHIAIVVDEYGGTQGLITLEDVLEEIVGEIEDESDRVDQRIFRRSDGVFVCRASAETRKLFEILGIDEDAETVTVGGFVADLVGRVPRTGDVVEFHGFQFSVARASARRAERIEVRRIVAPAKSDRARA